MAVRFEWPLAYGFMEAEGNELHVCSSVADPAQLFLASLLGLHLGGVTFGRLRVDRKIDGLVGIFGKQDERTRDNPDSRAGELTISIRDGDLTKPDDQQYQVVAIFRHDGVWIKGISDRSPQEGPMRIDRDEFQRVGQWLHSFYQAQEGLQRPEGLWIGDHPDWEGIAAWLFDTYLNARDRGVSEADARGLVVHAIQQSEEWQAKHGGGVNPSLPIPTRLRVEGRCLMNEANEPVPLRSHDCFLGLLRFSLGGDLRPFMRYARDVAGSNCLRVFLFIHYIPRAEGLPALTPAEGLSWLAQFLQLAAEERLYVELTAGDAQVLLPSIAEQRQYFAAVSTVASLYGNAALLSPNEPWKNGMDPFQSLEDAQGILRSRGASPPDSDGDSIPPYDPSLDLISLHMNRSLDEDGYKWVRHQWEAWRLSGAVYHEEPIGCAEAMIEGKRDNAPDRFAQGALVGEIAGCGWCFHSDYGIRALVPPSGSWQDQCARAVGDARSWFKPEAQRWRPTRSGLGDSALVLDDAHALRVYQRLGDHEGQAVAVRPRGYIARAQNGWHVVQQSADGAFIDLAR